MSKNFRAIFRCYKIIHEAVPGWLSLTAVTSVINALKPLVSLFMSAQVINELSGGRDVQKIIIYAALTVISVFLLSVIGTLLSRKLNLINEYRYNAFEFLYVKRYTEFDFANVEDSAVNQKLANIRARANGNGLGLGYPLYRTGSIIQNIITMIVSFAMLAGMFIPSASYINNWITSPASNLLPVLLAAVSLTAPLFIRKLSKPAHDLIERENPKANTLFGFYGAYKSVDSAAKDIRIYNQAETLREIFKQRLNTKMWFWFFKRLAFTSGLSGTVNAFTGGAVYLFIGLRALYGMYPIGSVVQYVGAVTNVINTISSLMDSAGEMLNNVPYIENALEFLDASDPYASGSLSPGTERIEIEFKNVSFKYPGQTDEYALRNINLRFAPGKRLAVVGMNGSGKTTMVKLLCRLYKPAEGEILLNGKNINQYDYGEYLRLFNVVFQDFKLFSFSLGSSVAVSDEYDRKKAEDALLTAGFDRLKTLDKGLDTMLNKDCDKDGVSLSGGEQQKAAIARAVYRDAAFVIFDEPTAALDPISEYEVYTKLNSIVGGKTAVFISHRLSSCRFCDEIAVFNDGRIVQKGTHEELLNGSGGKYAEMWNAQAKYYVEQNRTPRKDE